MKQHLNQLRPATAALFAALVLPTAPVFAQDTIAAPPPPVIAAPPPVIITPPVATTPAPPPVATPHATPAPPSATRTRSRTTTRTTTTRSTAPARTATRAPAPARAPAPVATPAPAPAPVAQAPVEAAPPPAPVQAVPPPAAPVETAPAPSQTPAIRTVLPWIIGGLVVLALIAGFFLFRRRRTDEIYEEAYYEPAPPREEAREPAFVAPIDVAPVAAAEPIFIRPVADPVPERRPAAEPVADAPVAVPPPEEINVAEADHADVEALAASSEPVAGRPWLEFLMRPMRAGTSRDNAIVQFELTVGNTGDAPARNVRISTWVVAAGESSEMERSLIEPPADAAVQEVAIDAGEGATVEAKIGVSKEGMDESVLPVVHADARYTLPDGSEGRTHASFAVGVPAAESGELQPFLTDRSSGLRENVEARLYGEPERV
jgi:hypothetical protein